MTTPFWIISPTILLDKNSINQIWPTKEMIVEEKLNAITRLVLILTLLGYLITKQMKIIITGLLTIGSLIFLYSIQQRQSSSSSKNLKQNLKEAFMNPYAYNQEEYNPATYNQEAYSPEMYNKLRKKFTEPIKANPIMNVLMNEYTDNPERKEAAPSFNPLVEQEINNRTQQFITDSLSKENENRNEIDEKLFKDLGDSFIFDRSMIPFNANPSTTIPNDQDSFAKYCYGDMISCRDGNEFACVRNAPPQWNNL